MSEATGPARVTRTAPARGGAVAFIFVTILLDMFALGLIMPILPKLVESFVDNDTASASRIFGLFGTAWALMQFIFSPILGSLSDRFGRRPVVLLSNFGLGARLRPDGAGAIVVLAVRWPGDLRHHVRKRIDRVRLYRGYHAGRTARGHVRQGRRGVRRRLHYRSGGRRPAWRFDPRLPFWVAAALSFANALYGLLILPESLALDRRSPFRWKSANPLGALRLLRSNPVLTRLSVVTFIGQIAHEVLPSTFVLYATYRYGWTAATVGLTLALVGICAMAVQGLAIGPIVTRFGEHRALLLALGCGIIGFLIFGVAPSGPLFWVGIPVMALWGVARSATQALTTRLVAPDQQGQLQGATSSVQSVSQLLGPILLRGLSPISSDRRRR